MEYKRVIILGDSHARGDGAEWPGIYGHLGPIPHEYRANTWKLKVKTAKPEEYPKLHQEFYGALYEKLVKNSEEVLKLRKTQSWGAHFAKLIPNCKYENYSTKDNEIESVLPFFKGNCEDMDLRDSLVILGVGNSGANITFRQNGTKLKNISVVHIAQSIMLIKEFVENRGGHLVVIHPEEFPESLYDPELNPYWIDLSPLLIHEGNFESMLGTGLYWRRFDGRHYDAGVQKVLGQNIFNLVADMH
jgi:hypothetical protein